MNEEMAGIIFAGCFCLFTIVVWVWVVFLSGAAFLSKGIDGFYNNPKKFVWRFMYRPIMLKIITTIFLLAGIYGVFLSMKQ